MSTSCGPINSVSELAHEQPNLNLKFRKKTNGSDSQTLTRRFVNCSSNQVLQLYSLPVRDIGGDAGIQAVAVSPCPICFGESARPTFAIEGMAERVMTCEGCGLGRLWPVPGPARLAQFYPAEYYGTQGAKFEPLTEWLVRLLSRRRAHFLARGLPAGARVLDIGCGRGTILTALARRGCEAHGLERDADATHGVTGDVHIRVAEHLSEVGYPDGHFQLVVLWHVFEHLTDIRGTLTEIHRVLTPGGKVVIAVPNFSSRQARWAGADWFHLDLPRHVFHFPHDAIRRLLENCGFEVRSEHHFSLRHNPFGWIQSWLNRFPHLPRNGLYVLLQKYHVPLPFSARLRWLLKFVYFVTMPWALLVSIRDTVLRRGATVHLVAVRK